MVELFNPSTVELFNPSTGSKFRFVQEHDPSAHQDELARLEAPFILAGAIAGIASFVHTFDVRQNHSITDPQHVNTHTCHPNRKGVFSGLERLWVFNGLEQLGKQSPAFAPFSADTVVLPSTR
eukprot:4072256-Amphidinium_carterae.1